MIDCLVYGRKSLQLSLTDGSRVSPKQEVCEIWFRRQDDTFAYLNRGQVAQLSKLVAKAVQASTHMVVVQASPGITRPPGPVRLIGRVTCLGGRVIAVYARNRHFPDYDVPASLESVDPGVSPDQSQFHLGAQYLSHFQGDLASALKLLKK